MPLMIACPHPKCNYPGPLGFNNPKPWGMLVYHGGTCPGMWLYNTIWYENEGDAWKQYIKDRGPFDPDWTAAYDALILHNDERKYKKYIKRWKNKYD